MLHSKVGTLGLILPSGFSKEPDSILIMFSNNVFSKAYLNQRFINMTYEKEKVTIKK